MLLGECKWGVGPVGRSVVRELVDKATRVVPGEDWQVHYVLFARAGFTDAARSEAGTVGAWLIDDPCANVQRTNWVPVGFQAVVGVAPELLCK